MELRDKIPFSPFSYFEVPLRRDKIPFPHFVTFGYLSEPVVYRCEIEYSNITLRLWIEWNLGSLETYDCPLLVMGFLIIYFQLGGLWECPSVWVSLLLVRRLLVKFIVFMCMTFCDYSAFNGTLYYDLVHYTTFRKLGFSLGTLGSLWF